MKLYRLLIYEGEEEKIKNTLKRGGVPTNGIKIICDGLEISSATIEEPVGYVRTDYFDEKI